MTRGRKLGLVLVVAGALALGVRAWPSPEPPSSVTWAAGRERTYTLDWSTRTTSKLVGDGERGALGSAVSLSGKLVLASYGREGDAFVLGASFEGLTRADVEALGKPLFASVESARAELEGKTAELFVLPSGEIRDVRFRPRDPALFRYLMTALVKELDLRVPNHANDVTTEGPSGSGTVHFARRPDQPFVVTRTRASYDALAAWPAGQVPKQTLESVGTAVLDAQGGLEELFSHESLDAARDGHTSDVTSTSSFKIVKATEKAFDASRRLEGYTSPPKLEERPAETEEARQERLAARSEGVSVESVAGDVRVHALAPRGRSTRWAWVAEAYFELHPEKTSELLPAMKDDPIEVKGLGVDVLLSIEQPEAQRALVRAFDDPTVIKPGVEHAMLLQRLARVEHPTNEMTDWIGTRYARAKADNEVGARRAAALALGGIVFALAKTDRAAARKLDDALVLDLYAAKDPKDREMLLLGIGNAGLDEDAVAIRLMSHDEAPDVRVAAATALRKVDGPDARAALLSLFGDREQSVQLAALSSLDRRDLGRAELDAMGAIVERHELQSLVAEALVNVLAKRVDSPAARAMLDLLGEDERLDAKTRARALRVRAGS